MVQEEGASPEKSAMGYSSAHEAARHSAARPPRTEECGGEQEGPAADRQQETEELLRRVEAQVQALRTLHDTAKARLARILKDDEERGALESLLQMALQDKEAAAAAYDMVRSRLYAAVVLGEGEVQITTPQDIVPWCIPSRVRYQETMDALRRPEVVDHLLARAQEGDGAAAALLDERERLFYENRVFRKLFERRYEVERDGTRRSGYLNLLFQLRAERVRSGSGSVHGVAEPQQRAQEHHNFNEKVRALAARAEASGGILCQTERPLFKLQGKKQKIAGYEEVAVLVVPTGEEQGEKIWKVAAAYSARTGDCTDAMAAETARGDDFFGFPHWLRTALIAAQRESGGRTQGAP